MEPKRDRDMFAAAKRDRFAAAKRNPAKYKDAGIGDMGKSHHFFYEWLPQFLRHADVAGLPDSIVPLLRAKRAQDAGWLVTAVTGARFLDLNDTATAAKSGALFLRVTYRTAPAAVAAAAAADPAAIGAEVESPWMPFWTFTTLQQPSSDPSAVFAFVLEASRLAVPALRSGPFADSGVPSSEVTVNRADGLRLHEVVDGVMHAAAATAAVADPGPTRPLRLLWHLAAGGAAGGGYFDAHCRGGNPLIGDPAVDRFLRNTVFREGRLEGLQAALKLPHGIGLMRRGELREALTEESPPPPGSSGAAQEGEVVFERDGRGSRATRAPAPVYSVEAAYAAAAAAADEREKVSAAVNARKKPLARRLKEQQQQQQQHVAVPPSLGSQPGPTAPPRPPITAAGSGAGRADGPSSKRPRGTDRRSSRRSCCRIQ